jgi:hypothetical protein
VAAARCFVTITRAVGDRQAKWCIRAAIGAALTGKQRLNAACSAPESSYFPVQK